MIPFMWMLLKTNYGLTNEELRCDEVTEGFMAYLKEQGKL